MTRWILLILLVTTLIFRIWDLSNVPNGFSWDEMDNTYQAYSLLKTGKDIFGNPLPVLLHSFADYKSSLYIYMTVPFVAWGGMTILTSKAAAVLFGIISILIIGVLGARTFKNINWGIVAGITMGLSPWWFAYSRLSFEAVGMMAFFLIGFALFPKKLILSALMFSLSVWTYSTAKLFAPLFLLILVAYYWKKIGLKKALLALFCFGILVLPVQWQSFFGKGGTRFNEISIFTDPTTASEVNFQLESGQVSSGVPKEVGLSPRIVDRLAHNKFAFWGNRLVNNYLQAFSTDFLFIKGDPNLRHSPGKNNIGQLLITDAIFITLGLEWLFKKNNWLLGLWLLLAPISSVVTRDGGTHATRLLFMLPPLVFLTTAGIRQMFKVNKILLSGVLAVHLFFVFGFGYYYFSHYRFESLKPFHWGFDTAVSKAYEYKDNYQQIVFDFHQDSALMAFLVATKYDPRLLQSQHPLPQREIAPGFSGNSFENAILLSPGNRPWKDFSIPASTLLVISADQPLPKQPLETIYYPDSTEAFYLIGY
jgi:hypothetical protein